MRLGGWDGRLWRMVGLLVGHVVGKGPASSRCSYKCRADSGRLGLDLVGGGAA